MALQQTVCSKDRQQHGITTNKHANENVAWLRDDHRGTANFIVSALIILENIHRVLEIVQFVVLNDTHRQFIAPKAADCVTVTLCSFMVVAKTRGRGPGQE